MKSIIMQLIFLSIFMLTGCDKYYSVRTVHKIDQVNGVLCQYSEVQLYWRTSWYDSCGKYKVGDKIEMIIANHRRDTTIIPQGHK